MNYFNMCFQRCFLVTIIAIGSMATFALCAEHDDSDESTTATSAVEQSPEETRNWLGEVLLGDFFEKLKDVDFDAALDVESALMVTTTVGRDDQFRYQKDSKLPEEAIELPYVSELWTKLREREATLAADGRNQVQIVGVLLVCAETGVTTEPGQQKMRRDSTTIVFAKDAEDTLKRENPLIFAGAGISWTVSVNRRSTPPPDGNRDFDGTISLSYVVDPLDAKKAGASPRMVTERIQFRIRDKRMEL